ncbi:MAG: flagellar motor stator protein MotA [Myxococcales bacterium FL481]|nr:MAG: flagellar motor stator protein MotA [Myxococcales bacterium FL481]
MISIVGMVMVIGCVLGGYVMHHGDVGVLVQVHEYIIIFGAAIGSMLVATPMTVIKGMVAQAKGVLGHRPGKQDYIDLLTLMFEMFQIAQRSGLLGWEEHINEPEKSKLFSKYASFLKNHHAVEFMTDTMKVIVSGSAEPHDLEGLMDADLDTQHGEHAMPPAALTAVSDSMPGLGIVAAVLGIITTMGAIDGPPSVIGMNVASALVGTFVGILASYGFMGPYAKAMEAFAGEEAKYVECIKWGLLAHVKGVNPGIAVEFARRSVPTAARPTFEEVETACRNAKSSG